MLWLLLLASEFCFFNFYWSIAALQCCVSFCSTAKWFSNMCIYIPSLPPQSIECSHYTVGYISFWWEICCYFIFNFFLEGKVSLLSVFTFFFIVFLSLALMCLMFLCCCLVTKSCLIFGDHTDCSLPGSSVHGFPGENTGVRSHFLLWGIFLIQGSNPHLLHWQMGSLPLHYLVWVYPTWTFSATWICKLMAFAIFGQFSAITSLSTSSLSPYSIFPELWWHMY